MHKIQYLAGMLASIFTKNPQLEEKEQVLEALSEVQAEFTASEGAAPAATTSPATPPVPAAPVAAAAAEAPKPETPAIDVAAITAQVTQAVMASPQITALQEKAQKWDAHQAAIGNAGTPAADAGAPPSSQAKELTMEQIQAVHKYAFD